MVVGFSLGGAWWVWRRRRSRPLSLHLPQRLKGRMVQTLLCQKALGGVKQQQVLTDKRQGGNVLDDLWMEKPIAEMHLDLFF